MVARRDSAQGKSERFERALRRASDAPLRTGNELKLLKDGPATFEDWLGAIGKAERWVHLENYIFENDAVGRRFADALSRKAEEGVPVRVLYDWFGCSDVPGSFWDGLRRVGAEVRAVNPLGSLVREGVRSFARRDHRKLLGVDGLYASVGGVCIAEGWLERSSETGLPYRDTAVGFRGPAVADAEGAFAGVWDLSGPEPLPLEERPEADRIAPAGASPARVVAQEPGKARALRTLQILLAAVEERMWITDAYFLSAPTLTQALISASRDGADVRLLLPATNDLPWIGAASRAGYRPLLEAGVRIFEYGGPMIHAKTHVADGTISRVGSTNLNFSGLLVNWEADLLSEDPDFGARMEEMFEEDLQHAREVRLSRGPGARRPRAAPDRPVERGERRDRRRSGRGSLPGPLRGNSGAATATASRLGGEALRGFTDGAALGAYERKLGNSVRAGVLGLSLLAAWRPRLVAWPLAATGALGSGLGLLRNARTGSSGDNAEEAQPR
jgi:cardiolipin synthase